MVNGLPPLIDFHCHLSRSGGLAVLDRSIQQTLTTEDPPPRIMAVTNTPGEWRTLSKIAHSDRLLWGVGLHPAERHTNTALAEFHRALPQADAVGEVGLDFRRAMTAPDEQCRRLQDIFDHLNGQRKIVSLHSAGAGAASAVLDCLTHRDLPAAILHWFLAPESVIDRAVDLDLFFSVNQVMLQSQRGRYAVAVMPPNRVLLETDAPFGVARKGTPVNVMAALEAALTALARIWRLPKALAREQVVLNQDLIVGRSAVTGWH